MRSIVDRPGREEQGGDGETVFINPPAATPAKAALGPLCLLPRDRIAYNWWLVRGAYAAILRPV